MCAAGITGGHRPRILCGFSFLDKQSETILNNSWFGAGCVMCVVIHSVVEALVSAILVHSTG